MEIIMVTAQAGQAEQAICRANFLRLGEYQLPPLPGEMRRVSRHPQMRVIWAIFELPAGTANEGAESSVFMVVVDCVSRWHSCHHYHCADLRAVQPLFCTKFKKQHFGV